jgi:hypothetical protein
VPGAQRLLHRFIEQALGIEPATGAQVQAGGRHHCLTGRPGAQQVGKQVVITIPVTVFVQRYQEYLMREQKTQDLGTVMRLANGVAQFAAKTLLRRCVIQKCLHLGGQAIDDFFEQVIANQPFPTVQGLGQRAFGAGFGSRQQPETQASDPALAALDQALQRFAAQGGAVSIEQGQGFVVGQAQILFMQLEQLPRQAQACQMPVRTLATGDHHQQAVGKMIEEKLQATIEHRPLGQMVIIEYQQQWRRRQQMHGQLVEQTVQPFFEGKRLMPLTHFQQAQGLPAQLREKILKAFEQPLEKSAGVVVSRTQPQPQTLPVSWQPLAELYRQRTLAKPRRCADQQQPATKAGTQTLA